MSSSTTGILHGSSVSTTSPEAWTAPTVHYADSLFQSTSHNSIGLNNCWHNVPGPGVVYWLLNRIVGLSCVATSGEYVENEIYKMTVNKPCGRDNNFQQQRQFQMT